MAKLLIQSSDTGLILRFKLLDNRVAYPQGLTGLAYNTANLVIATILSCDSVTTRFRASSGEVLDATLGTWVAPTNAAHCRFKEVDPTNHPGIYELQLVAARWDGLSNGANALIVSVHGAANLVEADFEIQLDPKAYTVLSVEGDVGGKVLGAGSSVIVGTGVQIDSQGNDHSRPGG